MHPAELAALDLNLLRALHALLVERHVTRAARRAGTSQPAMSRALTKLRAIFEDELLVRVGQTMQATPRAVAFVAPLEAVLRGIRDLITEQRFDPSTASGTIRIAALDILTYMLVPPLLVQLSHEAPRLALQVVQWSHRWHEHLESGEVDITIGQPAGAEPGIYSRSSCRTRGRVCFAAATPLSRGDGPGSSTRGCRICSSTSRAPAEVRWTTRSPSTASNAASRCGCRTRCSRR
jgi:DNA-binding transcriptional LysR family regulator